MPFVSAVTLTVEQALALAPDAKSAKAGQGLATPHRWRGLGADERAVWGECQGSGSLPYQTRAALPDFATRCSCPSPKFPCKHALALLLLWATDPAPFGREAPAWVEEWLAARAGREAVREKKAAAAADPAAQAKRAAAREKKVRAGLEELDLWLRDLVRGGLAGAPARGHAFWDAMGARLVDAQAPGAARLARDLAGAAASGDGWPDRLLDRLARLHLLASAGRRPGDLPEAERDDVRAALGRTPDTAEVLAGPAVRDRWAVLGAVTELQGNLTARRTWLRGDRGADALVLEFAPPGVALPPSLPVGRGLDAELCFYPSAAPLRALVKARHGLPRPLRDPPGESDWEAALDRHARALAASPWAERWPLVLTRALVVPDGPGWAVRDASDRALPIHRAYGRVWDLLALSGGHPLGLMGEWDGEALRPLGAGRPGEWHDVAPVDGGAA